MELSVVIVTHSQHDLLRQCVLSVLSTLREVDGELIVVDNASTDYTPNMMAAEFPDVRFLRNEVNLHYTRAVNQGMRATSGEFILLLNDDTEIEPARRPGPSLPRAAEDLCGQATANSDRTEAAAA